MQDNWNDNQPIYRQLRDRVAGLVLDGTFIEGEAIPSVRHVASEFHINHLTVSKAYQELVEDGVLEMRRGRGMFVVHGAQKKLLSIERHKFIQEELPALFDRLGQLGISPEDLCDLLNKQDGKPQ